MTSRHCGLIILGNSGVGKSFLANVLLGREAFKHGFSPRSVTHEMEYEEIIVGNQKYAIFNIPGLIESNQERIDSNIAEINKAFTEQPYSLVIYVFGEQGGRIRDEDVVAFNAINNVYPFNLESLVLVVNGLPKPRPKDYEGEAIALLEELIKIPCQNTCFLDMINTSNMRERDILKAQLLRVIVDRTPRIHQKEPGKEISLKTEEVRMLTEEIKRLREEFRIAKADHAQQIRENQVRYDKMMADRKEEADSFRRILEQQAEEAHELQQQILSQQSKYQEEQQRREKEHLNDMHRMQNDLQNAMTEMNNKAASDMRAALKEAEEQHARARAEMTANHNQAMQMLNSALTAARSAPPPSSKKSSCFVAGTVVEMADGTQKPIEMIEAGDVIFGADGHPHKVMFLDVEQLGDRHLYGINGSPAFATTEHVFITAEGSKMSIDPMASVAEEPSLQGNVEPLLPGVQLRNLMKGRQSVVTLETIHAVESDPELVVFNIVLESGHSYYANGFAVSDMFPDLSRYPRMFKLLHLLWRSCAQDVDAAFDDILTPQSDDRMRFERLADQIKGTIAQFLD